MPVASDESFVIFLYINKLYRISLNELYLSNKVQSSERIKLAQEDDTLITNEEEIEMRLNSFFSNAVINLKIPKFENFDPFSEILILFQTIL